MLPRSLRSLFRSLRFRLLLWNAGAVLLTGAFILVAVREGVRYTLIFDLDQVLREDLQEIDLHLRRGLPHTSHETESRREVERKPSHYCAIVAFHRCAWLAALPATVTGL